MYGLKYIYVLFEFKHTVFFTSHRGYLLNTSLCVLRGGGSVNRLLNITLQVPGVGFSVAGLDRAKF